MELIAPFVIESADLTGTPAPVHADEDIDRHAEEEVATQDAAQTAEVDQAQGAEQADTTADGISLDKKISDDDVWDPRFYRGSYRYDTEKRRLIPIEYDLPAGSVKKKKAGAGQLTAGSGGDNASPDRSSMFPRQGLAMYYNPGVMEQVLEFRIEAAHIELCTECVGYAALLNRADLNSRVWVEWENGDVEGPFLVIDVAAKQHVEMLKRRGWVIDVDYESAMRRGMNRPLPATVWLSPP